MIAFIGDTKLIGDGIAILGCDALRHRSVVDLDKLYGKRHIVGLLHEGNADLSGPCTEFAAVHQNRFALGGNIVGVCFNHLPSVRAGVNHSGSFAISGGVGQVLIVEAEAHARERIAGNGVDCHQLHIRTHGDSAGVRAGKAKDVGDGVNHLVCAWHVDVHIIGGDLHLVAEIAVFRILGAHICVRVKAAAAVNHHIRRLDNGCGVRADLQREILEAGGRYHRAVMAYETAEWAVAAANGVVDSHVAENRRLAA